MTSIRHAVKYFLLFLLFSFQVQAFDLETSLVKIIYQNRGVSYGTGLLVRFRGENYVLTSEHVVLPPHLGHGSFAVQGNDEKKIETEFLTSDWLSGLALLKVKEELAPDRFLDLESTEPAPMPEAKQNILVVGYPGPSKSLSVDSEVQFLQESSSSLFMVVPTIFEIEGSSIEPGMSGGLAIDADLRPLGMLVHKRVYSSNDQKVDVIPFALIKSWIVARLTAQDPRAEVMRLTFASEDIRPIYGTGLIEFEYSQFFSGSASYYKWLVTCRHPLDQSYVKALPRKAFQKMQTRCEYYRKNRQSGYFPFFGFRPRGILNLESRINTPTTAQGFIQLMMDPKLQAVTYDHMGGSFPPGLSTTVVQYLYKQEQKVSAGWQTLSPKSNYKLQRVWSILMQAFRTQSGRWDLSMMESVSLGRLSSEDFDDILNGVDFLEDWKKLESENASFAKLLRETVMELDRLMSKDYML